MLQAAGYKITETKVFLEMIVGNDRFTEAVDFATQCFVGLVEVLK
jgi:hypothetical protein